MCPLSDAAVRFLRMLSALKLQRWTDLLASLLRGHYAATFEELAKDVPAYANEKQADAARMRTTP